MAAERASAAKDPTLAVLAKLWELSHALEVTSKRTVAALGVTAQQRMIIRLLGRWPGMSAGELARQLRIHKTTISVAMRRLEARGLITRVRDAQDRRRVGVGLTPAGAALDAPAHGTAESVVGEMLASLAPDVLAVADAFLTELARRLHEAGPVVPTSTGTARAKRTTRARQR